MSYLFNRTSVIRLLFIAAIITLLILNIDLDILTQNIKPSYFTAISWTILPVICALAVMAFRHALLLSDYSPPYKYVFSAIVLSAGFNYILPSRLAELLKATYLREKCSVPFSAGTSAVVVERLIDILIIGIIGATSILFLPNLGSSLKYIIILLSIIFIFFVLPRSEKIFWYISAKLPWPKITNFLNNLHNEIKNKIKVKLLYINLGLGFTAWTLNIVAFAVFFNLAIPDGLDIQIILTVFVASAIGMAIPILPAGLGTFEAAIVLSLKAYGFDFDESLALAIALRLTLLLAVTPLAVVISMKSGTGVRSFLAEAKSALRSSK